MQLLGTLPPTGRRHFIITEEQSDAIFNACALFLELFPEGSLSQDAEILSHYRPIAAETRSACLVEILDALNGAG